MHTCINYLTLRIAELIVAGCMWWGGAGGKVGGYGCACQASIGSLRFSLLVFSGRGCVASFCVFSLLRKLEKTNPYRTNLGKDKSVLHFHLLCTIAAFLLRVTVRRAAAFVRRRAHCLLHRCHHLLCAGVEPKKRRQIHLLVPSFLLLR